VTARSSGPPGQDDRRPPHQGNADQSRQQATASDAADSSAPIWSDGCNDLFVRDIHGQRAAILLPVIPDDAPDEIREGIARRRLTTLTGTCPCGARMAGPNREQRRQMDKDRRRGIAGQVVWSIEIQHEDDCPAVNNVLTEAIARWRA